MSSARLSWMIMATMVVSVAWYRCCRGGLVPLDMGSKQCNQHRNTNYEQPNAKNNQTTGCKQATNY